MATRLLVMPVGTDIVTALDNIRQQATATRNAFVDRTPTDPLGAIAWWSVWPEPPGGHPHLNDLVTRARAARYSWREITVALGEPDTRDAELIVQSRFTRRSRR